MVIWRFLKHAWPWLIERQENIPEFDLRRGESERGVLVSVSPRAYRQSSVRGSLLNRIGNMLFSGTYTRCDYVFYLNLLELFRSGRLVFV